MEGVSFFRRPEFSWIFPHQFEQFFVASLFGKPDVIGFRHLVEIHKFIVETDLFVFRFFGNDPCHRAGDAVGIQRFHNADALIAFLYIKPVHKLEDDDGITNAVVDLMIVKSCPFGRKFGFFRQQRHKVTGEGIGSAGGFCADDFGQGNIHQTQIDGGGNLRVGQNVV